MLRNAASLQPAPHFLQVLLRYLVLSLFLRLHHSRLLLLRLLHCLLLLVSPLLAFVLLRELMVLILLFPMYLYLLAVRGAS